MVKKTCISFHIGPNPGRICYLGGVYHEFHATIPKKFAPKMLPINHTICCISVLVFTRHVIRGGKFPPPGPENSINAPLPWKARGFALLVMKIRLKYVYLH